MHSSLSRYELLTEEYTLLSKQTVQLQSAVDRLEVLVQQDPRDDVVTKLSETYFHYQTSRHKTQAKACYLNYAETFLLSELEHFYKVYFILLVFHIKKRNLLFYT